MECSETQKSVSPNLNAVDLGKFVMAFLVVACHTNPIVNCDRQWVIDCFYTVIAYAVPFFFLSSGYLLGLKLKKVPEVEVLIPLDAYIRKMIRMYIACTLLYFPLAIAPYIQYGYSVPSMISDYLKGLVFWGEHYNSWQFWYLLSTIYSLLLIRFLLWRKLSIEKITVLALCFIPLMVGIDWLVDYEYSLPGYAALLQKLIANTIRNSRLLNGCLMIPLGLFLSRHTVSRNTSVMLFLIGLLFSMSSSDLIWTCANTSSAAGLLGIAINSRLSDSPGYKTLRLMSTDIFVLHMWVWTIYYTLIYQEKNFGADSFVVTCVVCILLSAFKQKLKERKRLSTV